MKSDLVPMIVASFLLGACSNPMGSDAALGGVNK
jgi:hypothetical protein